MRLQKASRCALFAMLELASHPDRQLSATDIAEKYQVSTNHLAKVLRDLGRAGMVESVRGAGGGYRFAANARRVTLLDVIQLFEDIAADCVVNPEPADETEIGRALCVVMGEIDDIARATLRSITIDTLLNLSRRIKEHVPEQGQETSSVAETRAGETPIHRTVAGRH